ncbi:MAG: AAA family ATPase [Armatimonadota bacterium]|nr:AAA family ATPase [Armatimonadota bacterium]
MDNPSRSGPSVSRVFIGRDVESAELSAGLDDALSGRGRLFVISGEPGIGKTMLAEHLAVRAQDHGARALWGRCWEGGGAPAYWPWIQIVRALLEEPVESLRLDEGVNAAYLARLLPELTERFGERRDAAPAAESAASRFRLFDAVTGLLKRASAVRPLVLILDDLHAADTASLLLLRFLARELRTARLLVTATYRDTEAERRADIAEMIAELVREGPGLRLRGFDRAEALRFIEGLTGRTPSQDDLTRICAATGGNPLFIREMVRLVAANPAAGRRGPAVIPEGVRAVIHQRLGALDADAIHMLSVAAVVGQDFALPLVAQVSALDPDRLLQLLARAERSDLVARVPGSSTAFRFSHGLVREVLYDDLPVAVRRELHNKIGTAIERLYGPHLTSHFGELAYHFAQVAATGQGARAVEYAVKAGDQAMLACAYEEAALQYRRALEALQRPGTDAGPRGEVLLRLGDAQARAGDYQQAKQSFMRAAELARQLEAPEQFARAALGFGEPQVEGLVERQLLALLQEALERLTPDDSALRARVLARLSLELSFSDDPALRDTLRDALSRQALEMARRLGDTGALAIALRARWLATWGPDGLEERSRLSEEMLGLARDRGDRETELVGRARRITSLMETGDMGAAASDIAAHVRLAEELRMPYHEWAATTLRACRALLDGDLERAEALAQKAPTLLPGRPIAQLAYLNQMTFVRWEQSRLGELRDAWQMIVERFPQTGFGMAWLSLTDADLGRWNDAGRALRGQIAALPTLPRGGLWLSTLSATALAAAHLDDADAAAAVYPLLLPYASRTIIIPVPHPAVCCGAASLYLGLLATVMSRWDEADAHFDAAIAHNTRVGARTFLARTQCEHARMLARRGRTADRDRALALLEQAEAAAHGLGLIALGRQCAHLRETVSNRTAAALAQAAAPAPRETSDRNVFHREGDYWTIVCEGSLVRVRDSKGLRYLSRLLRHPGREFHAIDLETEENREAPAAQRPGRQSGSSELDVRADLGDAGALLDARAKAEYQTHLQELQAELDEAERFNDPVRAARIKAEMDFIVRELARAVGLGGRDRRAASHAERARLNVTRAIKAAMENIARHHPALGRHLRSTIRTGRYCSYTPDPRSPIAWES